MLINKISPQSMPDEHLLPAALLEMGDSLNFIEVRKHTLRKEIKDSKLSAAAGKFSGLGAIVGGVALAGLSNPLGWLIGCCGLTAYTLSVFGQWLQTGKVHPMPLSSKSQDERDEDLAGSTVSGEGDSSTGRTAIHEEAAYLSDREKTEYELLHFAPQGLMSAMNNVPPAQRWACYQFLVDAFAAGTIGDYANPQALQTVLGNPSVYSSHLAEASKRFPQYGLPLSESLPIAATLPIGNHTRIGAVDVPAIATHPASDEVKEVGNVLCDRLIKTGRKAELEQISQRTKARDFKGALKMAIASNGLNAASFLDSFPGKAHLYDWANDAIAAVIPSAVVESPQPAPQELTVEEFIETTPVDKRLLDRSELISIEILDGLVASQRSTLLVGGTGAGKSVTQSYLTVNLLKRCADAEMFVISQKMDAFAGLNTIGRVTLFNPIDPAESLSIIDKVWNIYDQRRKLPEDQRHSLPPVRLLLCDWLSINAALESDKNNPEIKESRYLTKLTDIIYNGRELNVCLWIDLQSFNVKAIGMQTDANGRKNFNILGLGNYYVDANGGVNESYGVLNNMIQSKYMVDDETQRSRLVREFVRLKPVSQPNSRPVMFTTLEPARVALMADLRHYKMMQVVKPKKVEQARSVPSSDPWQPDETAEANESYMMPGDPTDRVKLAAKLVQESGIVSSDEIEQLVPGLSMYLPTVVLFYSECTRKGEVYKWAN